MPAATRGALALDGRRPAAARPPPADAMVKICCIGAGYVGGPTMAMIAYQAPDIEVRARARAPRGGARAPAAAADPPVIMHSNHALLH